MKLGELKRSGIIDDNQKVILIEFDGNSEKVFYKGYFKYLENDYDSYDVEISTLSFDREAKYGKNLLGIFI